MLAINQSKATSLGISQSAFPIGLHTVLTGFSSDPRFASQSPPANFKAAKRRSVFRLSINILTQPMTSHVVLNQQFIFCTFLHITSELNEIE